MGVLRHELGPDMCNGMSNLFDTEAVEALRLMSSPAGLIAYPLLVKEHQSHQGVPNRVHRRQADLVASLFGAIFRASRQAPHPATALVGWQAGWPRSWAPFGHQNPAHFLKPA